MSPAGRDGHFFHRAQARGSEREDARAAGSEPLGVVVDAVERDVDGAAGQPVDVAVARGRRGRAGRAAAFCCAPGISSAKTSTLRLPTGSFSICWLLTVVEIVVDEVSITVRAPSTLHGFLHAGNLDLDGELRGARRLDA